MRISTSTGTCGSVFWTQKMYYSCEQAIESIAKAGFDAIDLCFVAYGRKGLPMDAPDWRDWVKRQCGRKHEIYSAGLGRQYRQDQERY